MTKRLLVFEMTNGHTHTEDITKELTESTNEEVMQYTRTSLTMLKFMGHSKTIVGEEAINLWDIKDFYIQERL